MKYMMMTFGQASDMFETQSKDWITEMIAFMGRLNDDLRAAGELVDAQGLVDGREATTVRRVDGVSVATDGPYAEAKESLVGYWILDVGSEKRAVEVASRITDFLGAPIEVRRIADAPPEV